MPIAFLLADGQPRADPQFGLPEVSAALRLSDDGIAFSIDPALAPELLYNQLPPDVAARLVSKPGAFLEQS